MPNTLLGVDYLKSKLSLRSTRVDLRYRYYDQKEEIEDFRISTPEKLRFINFVLGWCTKAVDTLADRLVFDGFDPDPNRISEIYELNNADILYHSAILSALISSCCFICISEGTDGMPEMRVIDGANATGIIDETTCLLKEGYAILERDPVTNFPVIEAYFTPDYTYVTNRGVISTIPNPTGHPLLVPIIFKPDAKRPFGHSRISRACMDIIQAAMRTAKRSEITAEFYSFPQRWITGLDNPADFPKWEATISSFLRLGTSEDGEKPSLGQFSQMSMEPHITQFRMFAAMFAGETGLTLDDLGFATENPSSAEAIKAAHENLRLSARDAQRSFGVGFLNAGYLAACLRDRFPYERKAFRFTQPQWQPIFEPDAAMLSGIGDGMIKINQAVPEFFGQKNVERLTGITADESAGLPLFDEEEEEEDNGG